MSAARSPILTQLAKVEAEMAVPIATLAALLDQPPARWDATAIGQTWARVDALRPSLQKQSKTLAGARRDKPQDRAGRVRKRAEISAHQRLRHDLGLWNTMKEIILRHAKAPSSPLDLTLRRNHGDRLDHMIYTALHRLANAEDHSDAGQSAGHFSDIAMPIKSFDLMMGAAFRLMAARGRTQGLRFLDIGCGGGTKVLAATRYFDQCSGLEYDAGFAAAAQKTLAGLAPAARVIHGDALAYDGYGECDVIYAYRPITEDARLADLYARVVAQARPGTLLIAAYGTYPALRPEIPIEAGHVIGPIYAPGLSTEAARTWRDDAAYTDPLEASRPLGAFRSDSLWQPILQVARYVGGLRDDPLFGP